MPNVIHKPHSPHPLSSELKQSESNILLNLANGLARITQYILNSPGKAIVLGLAGQVIGSSALGKSQNHSSIGSSNLTQGFINKPYLADSLAAIEQRVAPALNLTWLNQTDSSQMPAIPAWLDTNDTYVDEPSHRVKRSFAEEDVKRYLLSHDVCLRNVVQNYEYFYASGYQFNGKIGRGRRRVFTWGPGNRVIEAPWRFETDDNGKTFYIKNQKWGEYLYASPYKYDDDRRYLATWMPGNRVVEAGKWRIELLSTQGPGSREGDLHIALWNDHYSETLYAANFKWDDQRRHIFTWVPETCVLQVRWKVENCDSGRRSREIPDRLEGATSPEEKESSGYLDKTPTRFAFFQIRQPDQGNMTLESTSSPDFDRSNENQTALSQLGQR